MSMREYKPCNETISKRCFDLESTVLKIVHGVTLATLWALMMIGGVAYVKVFVRLLSV
jgi:hypothetical protein